MKLSVIIPVLQEEGTIGPLVAYIKRCSGQHLLEEILVVDGGSTDATRSEAEAAGARVVVSEERGRARQMNKGAHEARGNVFYFLHADSYPPRSFITDISIYTSQHIQAGCYQLAFDYPHTVLNLYAWFTQFDVNVFRFGDQSLFISKELFRQLGGFKKYLSIMEDQDMVIRIKRVAPFKIINDVVVTSARKYRENGIYRLQAVFSLILVMYYMGFGQDFLKKVYKFCIKTSVPAAHASILL